MIEITFIPPFTGLSSKFLQLISDSKTITIPSPPKNIMVTTVDNVEYLYPVHRSQYRRIIAKNPRLTELDIMRQSEEQKHEKKIIPEPTIIWEVQSFLKWPHNLESEWIVFIYNDKDLLGYAGGSIEDKNHITGYIEYVHIHPLARNKGLCKPMLTFALRQLIEHYPTLEYIQITNASEQATAACLCYYRAGKDAGFNVIPGDEKTQCFLPDPTGDYVYSRKLSI